MMTMAPTAQMMRFMVFSFSGRTAGKSSGCKGKPQRAVWFPLASLMSLFFDAGGRWRTGSERPQVSENTYEKTPGAGRAGSFS